MNHLHFFGGVLAMATALPHTASAQSISGPKTIAVGAFTSVKECTVYEESEGTNYSASSSAVAANRYGFVAGRSDASYSTWRTWLVKDCIDHFESLRATLKAALASTGPGLVVSDSGSKYVVTGSISDIRNASQSASQKGFSDERNTMEVTFSLLVKDRNGRSVIGRSINKSIDLDRSITAGGFNASSTSDGEGLYTALEREVALAATKIIAFSFNPITVVSINGSKAVLSYGSPTLDTGDLVQLMTPDGRIVKMTVSGSVGGRSVANVEGRQDISNVPVGAVVEYLDPSSAAANGRRFERVDLP